MKITSKYTVAIQILLISRIYSCEKITSNFLSNKIGADAVIIRQVMLDLKKANYISGKPGPGGSTLIVPLNTITLFDVYNTVSAIDESMFKFYDTPESDTSYEKKIYEVTSNHFEEIQNAMYEKMKTITLQNIYDEIKS